MRYFKSTFFSIAVMSLLLFTSPFAIAQETSTSTDMLKRTQNAFVKIAKEVSPSVVYIEVQKVIERRAPVFPFGDFNQDFFERFFGDRDLQNRSPNQQFRQRARGSGFIIDEEGYILTNHHVVGEADKITVKLADGREFEAENVGTDPRSDVGVIKIDAQNLPALKLGDSNELEVGEWVVAIGNPFGLSKTVTSGIISAKGRSNVGITDYEDFIQTDAAINPGNSGGPLVNLEGEVIGLNTAIFSRSGGYMGIGFAIPINMAKVIYKQLRETGKVTRSYLGIMVQQLTPELAESFELERTQGVLIADVLDDSPAQKAGLKQGDIIVEMNGKSVKKYGQFRNKISLLPPETTIDLKVIRNGSPKTIEVTTAELPEQQQSERKPETNLLEDLGFTVQNLTDEYAQRFDYEGEEGVLVTKVVSGSVAAMKGIRPGLLIQEVNQKKVTNVNEFNQQAQKALEKGRILLLVREGDSSRYVAFSLDN